MDAQDTIIKLPGFVRELAGQILGGYYCYDEIIGRLNFHNTPCLKLGLSKALGLAIVLGGCIVKIPQILKIVRSKSVAGISLLSYLLETFSYVVSIAYNLRNQNPISTWGETGAIAIQNFIIIGLLASYSRNYILFGLLPILVAVAYYTLIQSDLISLANLSYLQAGTIPITLFSRIPQIVSNYQMGSTGQLAAFTVFNFFLGTLARVFTTLQEVDDMIILTSFLLALVLNTILAGQMIYYWNTKPTEKVKEKVKKNQ